MALRVRVFIDVKKPHFKTMPVKEISDPAVATAQVRYVGPPDIGQDLGDNKLSP